MRARWLPAVFDSRRLAGFAVATFVAHVLSAVPEARLSLPPTALGKDFHGPLFAAGLTPSQTGLQVALGGLIGLTIGWVEGIEVNVLGLVAGLDLRAPAVKLPGFGRIGLASEKAL